MKKIIVFFAAITLSVQVLSQAPCSEQPTANELLKLLEIKPVTEMNHLLIRTGCNVNDALKKRLLYLASWKWTQKEIQQYLERDIKEHGEVYRVEEKVQSLSKGNDSLAKQVKDSIVREYGKIELDNLVREHYFGVHPQVILSVAYLDMKQAIPVLLNAVTDNVHYDTETVKLALARLGNKTYEKEIYAKARYNPDLNGQQWMNENLPKARALLFIANAESIYRLAEWLDASKTYNPMSEGDEMKKCCSVIISSLSTIIKNRDFQALVAGISNNPWSANDKMIVNCKKWLLENKGRYIINRSAAYY